jgi:hypothetical protein
MKFLNQIISILFIVLLSILISKIYNYYNTIPENLLVKESFFHSGKMNFKKIKSLTLFQKNEMNWVISSIKEQNSLLIYNGNTGSTIKLINDLNLNQPNGYVIK